MLIVPDRDGRNGFDKEALAVLVSLYDHVVPPQEFVDSDWLTNPKEHNQLPKNW